MPYSVVDDVKEAIDLVREGATHVSFEAIARRLVPNPKHVTSRKNKVRDLVAHRHAFKRELVKYLGAPPKGAKTPDNYLSLCGAGACRVIPITPFYEKQQRKDKEFEPRDKQELIRCVAGRRGSTEPSGYLLADRAPKSIALIWSWHLQQTSQGVLGEQIINLQICEDRGDLPSGTADELAKALVSVSARAQATSRAMKRLLAAGEE